MFKKKFKIDKLIGSWNYWSVNTKKSIFHKWKLEGLFGEREDAERYIEEKYG